MAEKKKKKMDLEALSTNVDFDEAMKNHEILTGLIVRTEKYDSGSVLIVQIDGKEVIILKDQMGYMPVKKHLGDMVGYNLKVVLTEKENDNTYYGSYIEACKLMAEPTMEKLKNGGQVMGVVRDLQDYGVYVTIAEGTYAMLPNRGCVTGAGLAKDYLQKGKVVDVKLTNITNAGKIYVELVEKIETQSVENETLEKANLYKGQVLLANVTRVTSKVIHVKLKEDIPALALIPPDITIIENSYVRYEIIRINQTDGTIMGRILARLQ